MNKDNKNRAAEIDVPTHFSLTALLSAILTIVSRILYFVAIVHIAFNRYTVTHVFDLLLMKIKC